MPEGRGTLGVFAGEGGGLLELPPVEAIPAEFVGSANLVGETEGIDPALLFRPPPAIPRELNHPRLSTALDHRRPDEIGATRTGIHLNPIDHPFRMGMKQLVDEADDFDPGDGAYERDGCHIGARRERDHIGLESIGRAGAGQDFGVDWHGRNISGHRYRLGTSSPSKRTKLTGESALERQGGIRQW
jgi:hypothetical protein